MVLQLFGHPLSSYHQKALIAFYETGTTFKLRMLDEDNSRNLEQFLSLWPVGKFPLLVDGDKTIMESSIIIEYVAPQLVPKDIEIEVRMLDRIFDNYVMTPMQKFSADAMRPVDAKDPAGVADAASLLDNACAWINTRLAQRKWAAGDAFTLADCAAAPALFYANWALPIPSGLGNLNGYVSRLQSRPSVVRAAREAGPFLHMVPLPKRA